MSRIKVKIRGTILRLWQAFYFLPLRLGRLGKHLVGVFSPQLEQPVAQLPISPARLWWLEMFLLLTDVMAVPEILETLSDWLKWNTRPLNQKEIEIARSVFGETIDYRRVRLDESARVACRNRHVIYVGFFTINSWGQFGEATLIHEMVHVWQFQRFGSIYISRALMAQRTAMGYNYGGVQALAAREPNPQAHLLDFNFEQQADIIADGFCLRKGLRPRWVEKDCSQLAIFEKYMDDLQQEFKSTKVQGIPA